jgi:hypothetical protein
VLTYCTNGSPHDQYYFRRPRDLVSGAVQPPRLDLVNEDLIRAHVHAIWLAETQQDLRRSVAELLDLKDLERLPLLDSVRDALGSVDARNKAHAGARRVLRGLAAELGDAPWYDDEWLDAVVSRAPQQFDAACQRWRRLYRAAEEQAARQNKIVHDAARNREEKRVAERLRAEAEMQSRLLTTSEERDQGDFYSYRYFASEGFLPGYNFPRLPLSAYLPGRDVRTGRGQFLSRARFLALSEYGPRSIIYHEGTRFRVARALFASQDADRQLVLGKVCQECGYGYFGADAEAASVCGQCENELRGEGVRYFDRLLRLANVSTQRVDRITSDEEERLRLGYELKTAYRFDDSDGGWRRRTVRFLVPPATDGGAEAGEERVVADATYAPAATLWGVNLGWLSRKDRHLFGFPLDMETGRWESSEQEEAPPAPGEVAPPGSERARIETVVPFVEDRRNTLVLRLDGPYDAQIQVSVQYALKRGIEARYQLEDAELATEPLPDRDNRKAILYYEAAEGGAGVLTRLADEPEALAAVARTALEICHFDPDTGDDVGRGARHDDDPCVAACYDCLLSYSNQRDHQDLDRFAARAVLLELAGATGRAGAGGMSRVEQFQRLTARCDSDLERRFLRHLYEGGFRLPDAAQELVDEARPDFLYAEHGVCVFVDGPVHAYSERAARDAAVRDRLSQSGYDVVAVGDEATWAGEIARYAYVFGAGGAGEGE